MISTKKK